MSRIYNRTVIDEYTRKIIDRHGLSSSYVYSLIGKYDVQYPDGYYVKMRHKEKIETAVAIWYTKLIENRRRLLKNTIYDGVY